MKNKLLMLLSAALLLTGVVGGLSITGADAKPDSVKAPVTVDHNETTLSLFSCAATRTTATPSNTNHTINHSHRIAAESVTGHIDAFDCEGYAPGDVLTGCVWRTYYIYDDVPGGGDLGIVGPTNRVCWHS